MITENLFSAGYLCHLIAPLSEFPTAPTGDLLFKEDLEWLSALSVHLFRVNT